MEDAAGRTETPGAAFTRAVHEVYELAPAEVVQLATIARQLDELAELEQECDGAPWVVTGNRGAEIANPRRTLLMRARREVRDAISKLGLPDPDEDPDAELSPSDLGARLARRRWSPRAV